MSERCADQVVGGGDEIPVGKLVVEAVEERARRSPTPGARVEDAGRGGSLGGQSHSRRSFFHS
jgi:hypothetical protein